jgi:peroxidase
MKLSSDAECCHEEVIYSQNLLSSKLKQCFNVNVTEDLFYADKGLAGCHPFTRSDAICTGCDNNVREQFNAITAFIDASNVYGSDPVTASGLRADSWRSGQPTHGELRQHSSGPAIPSRKQCGFTSHSPAQDPEDLVAGDVRAIEQPGLASLHSLFVNEHNQIVQGLKDHERLKSTLKTSGTKEEQIEADEKLYQEARRLVGAEIQQVVYGEFLPLVLGSENMRQYGLSLEETSTYNVAANPTIRNEFATVAFRFGHSLIPSIFQRPSSASVHSVHDRWALDETFFKFEEFVLGSDNSGSGWMDSLTGAMEQASPAMDTSITPLATDFLFCGENCQLPGGFGQDLAARNIQRGRDHGLPSYSDLR